MGSSASKGARTAAGSSARKYPSRVPPPSAMQGAKPSNAARAPEEPQARPGPTVHPKTQASTSQSKAIDIDASDPVYASQLRTIGVVDSNPFQSNTSTNPLERPVTTNRYPQAPASRRPQEPTDMNQPFPVSAFPHPLNNPAIAILHARERLQEQADLELQQIRKSGFEGRSFIDSTTIRQILAMRDDRAMSAEEIEKRLELKKGTVERLGPKGLVEGISN